MEVINLLTHFDLTPAQNQLLKKGLSFVPTWNTARNKRHFTALQLAQYHRRIKLSTYFGLTTTPDKKPFLPKSKWKPDLDKLLPEIQTLIQKDEETLTKLEQYKDGPNLTVQEENALQELRQNTAVVIEPADKGSTTVIMDRTDYVQEALRQLQGPIYYLPLDKPIFLETADQIAEVLDTLRTKKVLTKQQITYLKGEAPSRPRYFYLLPKIHKPQEKWTVPHRIPPGRPIVSDCGSESCGIHRLIFKPDIQSQSQPHQ